MEYHEFLKNLKSCPFCSMNEEEIIFQNDFGKIIMNIAPYYENHILIVPHKHIITISELSKDEFLKLCELEYTGIKEISKNYEDFSVLYREGNDSGKSIDHLHIHIIPKVAIHTKDIDPTIRNVYSKEEYTKSIKNFKDGLKL